MSKAKIIRFRKTNPRNVDNPKRASKSKPPNKGKHSSQTYRTAYILLNCDQGECSQKKLTNQQISKVLKIGMRAIDRVKKKFVEGGLEVALNRRPTTRIYERKVDGDVEAKLSSCVVASPPRVSLGGLCVCWLIRWSSLIMLKVFPMSRYKRFKKNKGKPWKVKVWVIPPKQSSEFVAHMKQVLDLYKRPYSEDFPVICMDEVPKQLIEESRQSLPMEPGAAKRIDYE